MNAPPDSLATRDRRRMPPGGGALFLLALISVGCLGALPWTLGWVGGAGVAPYKRQSLEQAYLPPSWAPHAPDDAERRAESGAGWRLMGADGLGRDLFVRIVTGGGISIGIGLAAAAISVVIGTVYGAAAAYAGGRTDSVMMRVVDVLYGLPYILLVVLLAVAVDALMLRWAKARGEALSEGSMIAVNVLTLLVAIGGVSWLTMARVIRGQVLSLKARPFVEAARATGAGRTRVFIRHLLPNLVGPIIVYGTLTAPQAILQESFLSFLGIGVRPPLPSWGNLAASGLEELNTVRPRWWLLLFPCLMLAVTLLALNFVGERLREAVDTGRAAPRTPPVA